MILRLSFYYYYYLVCVLGSVVSVSLSRSNRIGAYNEKSKWNKKYLYQNSASGSQHTQQNTSFQLSKANTVLLNAVCCVWDKTRRRRRRILNANIVAWYTCNVNFVVVSCSLESDCLAHNSLSFYISCSAGWFTGATYHASSRRGVSYYMCLCVVCVFLCVCVIAEVRHIRSSSVDQTIGRDRASVMYDSVERYTGPVCANRMLV